MLTHKGFNTYLVLIFSDLNKAQVYKMPCRVSSHDEIEMLMSFDYLKVFKPNEHTEDYHMREPNDETFLFEIEDKKCVYVGDQVFSFETTDGIVKFSSEYSLNDVKLPFAYGEENIYFMLHQNYINNRKYETSTEKDEHLYFSKQDKALKSDNIKD